MMRTATGDAFSAVMIDAMLLGARLEAEGDRIAEVAGHTSARWRVLASVEDMPRTVAAIARRLHLKRQSVQRIADDLREEGSLGQQPNPDDQRAALMVLTPSGKKDLAKIQSTQIVWANRLGAALGRKRLEALHLELQAVARVFETPDSPHEGASP